MCASKYTRMRSIKTSTGIMINLFWGKNVIAYRIESEQSSALFLSFLAAHLATHLVVGKYRFPVIPLIADWWGIP